MVPMVDFSMLWLNIGSCQWLQVWASSYKDEDGASDFFHNPWLSLWLMFLFLSYGITEVWKEMNLFSDTSASLKCHLFIPFFHVRHSTRYDCLAECRTRRRWQRAIIILSIYFALFPSSTKRLEYLYVPKGYLSFRYHEFIKWSRIIFQF